MQVQDMNNGVGALVTSTQPNATQKKWDGSKHAEFTIWKAHCFVFLQTITFLGWTVYDVVRGMDTGGVGAGAPAHAGNANAVLASQDAHTARLAKAAGIVIDLIEKGCNLRTTLENVLYPFLTNGKLAWDFIVQECTLALSASEIQKLLGDWVLLTMENVFPVNKYDVDSMREWIEYVLSYFEGVDPATPGLPNQQQIWDKIVNCVTDKFGSEKTGLIGGARPQRLVFNAGQAATAFAPGPPIILPQPAVNAGDWRVDLLRNHLLERWKVAIDNKQIHVMTKVKPNVNAVRGNGGKGRKPFNKHKKGNPRKGPPKNYKGKPANLKQAVCFRCGGVYHTAEVCPTSKDDAPSRKLLVQIKYPAGLCDDFKWPDGFADRDRPARINAIEDDDSDEDDEEDASEVADEDDTEDADDDFGNLVHMSIKDVVRDAAPRRNGWSRIFRNPFGARSATRW